MDERKRLGKYGWVSLHTYTHVHIYILHTHINHKYHIYGHHTTNAFTGGRGDDEAVGLHGGDELPVAEAVQRGQVRARAFGGL